ncbi:unnamed protein product [Leptosia nina]|uniref:Uncharacterized protein n=1 Tax=Leptosia nina TaxID=320188 RepID=A0AAV1JUW2_9NEOP
MRPMWGSAGAGGRRCVRGAPRGGSLVPVVGSVTERLREWSPPRRRSFVVVVRPPARPTPPVLFPWIPKVRMSLTAPARCPTTPGRCSSEG